MMKENYQIIKSNKMKNKLYLIPTFLNENATHIIPAYVVDILQSLDEFVVENEKTARQFLKKAGYKKSLNDVKLHLLNEHSTPAEISQLIMLLKNGKDIGLLSEAGCPAVADPGAELIKAAHQQNMEVVPLVGPSSVILSLMASGLNGQSFSFSGYLPKERVARIKALKELERIAISKNQTQIFIEAPYRNQNLLEDILQTCNQNTMLCIATEITGANEFIKTRSIDEWKKSMPEINKRPSIFLIGK
jgi:16S rRNA (cytidine1402-2'-O)-methyltransferase